MNIDENTLIENATNVMANAYSPYSNVKVGAALLAKSGKVFTGCNVENESYGLTICAERVAIGCAVSAGEREFNALAIVNSTERIFTPCGACCQVLAQFAPELNLILVNSKGNVRRTDLKAIFPESFSMKEDN
ncbi:cytidine deaminase [bacterium]|nr:cytidine deaminase [bacterium]